MSRRRHFIAKETANKTFAVDLDATLATYEKWEGHEKIGAPFEGADAFLKALNKEGRILIYTCRMNPAQSDYDVGEAFDIIKKWLEKHDLVYDEIYTGPGKPQADVYIDDKAVSVRPQEDSHAYERALGRIKSLTASLHDPYFYARALAKVKSRVAASLMPDKLVALLGAKSDNLYVDPDTLYKSEYAGDGVTGVTFVILVNHEGTREILSDSHITWHSDLIESYGYSEFPEEWDKAIFGRVIHFMGTPWGVMAFWGSRDAFYDSNPHRTTNQDVLQIAIPSIRQFKGGPIVPPKVEKLWIFGVNGRILLAPDQKTPEKAQRYEEKKYQVGDHKLSLPDMAAALHVMIKSSPEYQQLVSFICTNEDPDIKFLRDRVQCKTLPKRRLPLKDVVTRDFLQDMPQSRVDEYWGVRQSRRNYLSGRISKHLPKSDIDVENFDEEDIKIVTVLIQDHNGKILLVRRPQHENRPYEWECPGGHREPGESLDEAGIREVKEETGLDIAIQPGRSYFTTEEGDLGVLLRGVSFTRNFDLEETEHDKFLWISRSELKQLKFAKTPRDFLKEVEEVLRVSSLAGNWTAIGVPEQLNEAKNRLNAFNFPTQMAESGRLLEFSGPRSREEVGRITGLRVDKPYLQRSAS